MEQNILAFVFYGAIGAHFLTFLISIEELQIISVNLNIFYIFIYIFYGNYQCILGKVELQDIKRINTPQENTSNGGVLKGNHPRGTFQHLSALFLQELILSLRIRIWMIWIGTHNSIVSFSFMPPSVARIFIWQNLSFLLLWQGQLSDGNMQVS